MSLKLPLYQVHLIGLDSVDGGRPREQSFLVNNVEARIGEVNAVDSEGLGGFCQIGDQARVLFAVRCRNGIKLIGVAIALDLIFQLIELIEGNHRVVAVNRIARFNIEKRAVGCGVGAHIVDAHYISVSPLHCDHHSCNLGGMVSGTELLRIGIPLVNMRFKTTVTKLLELLVKPRIHALDTVNTCVIVPGEEIDGHVSPLDIGEKSVEEVHQRLLVSVGRDGSLKLCGGVDVVHRGDSIEAAACISADL